MTVRELMAALATMDADELVHVPDYVKQAERWGDGTADATLLVDAVVVKGGKVTLVCDAEDECW